MRAQLSDDVALKRSQAQDVAAKLKKRLGKSIQGLKLVEVGCAAGALLVGLADAGFDVRGVEVDQVNGQVALQRMGTGKVHIGSLETAAFADESFDVVFSDQVIEHVADTRPFVNECFRILKPGGLMWVGTPNFGGLSARLLKHRWKECVPTEHIRMFTPESMRYYLMGGGFSRVEVWTHGLSLVRRVGHAESEYRQNLLPLRREGLARRTLSKLASLASMGDGLSAFALRS
ncbi:MAG: methyltransferase domain-containing protein [Polyangiaceae bacterium]|nr:methyltransferase domain-containing protein [Polyangiaceae bacterium]